MNNDTSFVHYGAFLGRTYSYVKVLVVLTGTKVLVCARVLVCSCARVLVCFIDNQERVARGSEATASLYL